MTNIFITKRVFLVESLDLKNTTLGESLVAQELITPSQLDLVMVSINMINTEHGKHNR